MGLITSTVDMLKAWVATTPSETQKFMDAIGNIGDDANPLHAYYHSLSVEARDEIDPRSAMKCAINTNNPAAVKAVVSLVGNGDYTHNVSVAYSAPLCHAFVYCFDLLGYALHVGSDKAALCIMDEVDVTEEHLRAAENLQQTALVNAVTTRMAAQEHRPA